MQQCTTTCCRNLAGQLILKSSEVLKSPPLRERDKETQSNHSKSHKGENHTYTPKQIEKVRKSRELMSIKVRNWGFVIADSSSQGKKITGPRIGTKQSGMKSGGHDMGNCCRVAITRKTNLVA